MAGQQPVADERAFQTAEFSTCAAQLTATFMRADDFQIVDVLRLEARLPRACSARGYDRSRDSAE